MKKRITVMLLCACMSVSAYTGVQAADLSSGSSDSDVQIEMEEVDDSVMILRLAISARSQTRS